MITLSLEDVLKRMYESEINAEISCFWDGGFCVSLGDELNGYKEKSDCLELSEVADELHRLILKHYPESGYANINHAVLPPGVGIENGMLVAARNAGKYPES